MRTRRPVRVAIASLAVAASTFGLMAVTSEATAQVDSCDLDRFDLAPSITTEIDARVTTEGFGFDTIQIVGQPANDPLADLSLIATAPALPATPNPKTVTFDDERVVNPIGGPDFPNVGDVRVFAQTVDSAAGDVNTQVLTAIPAGNVFECQVIQSTCSVVGGTLQPGTSVDTEGRRWQPDVVPPSPVQLLAPTLIDQELPFPDGTVFMQGTIPGSAISTDQIRMFQVFDVLLETYVNDAFCAFVGGNPFTPTTGAPGTTTSTVFPTTTPTSPTTLVPPPTTPTTGPLGPTTIPFPTTTTIFPIAPTTIPGVTTTTIATRPGGAAAGTVTGTLPVTGLTSLNGAVLALSLVAGGGTISLVAETAGVLRDRRRRRNR